MGKARILTAQGEGLYSIEILEDRTRAKTARTTAVQRVAQIDSRITDLESELSSAQSAVDTAVAYQDQAIADYQAALQDDGIDTAAARQAMTAAGEEVLQTAAQRDALRGAIRGVKAERLALQSRIDRIDALPDLRQLEAWCADYTEDLDGEVATAEVPGEIGTVIIKPGFEDAAAWSPSADGAIQPALAGTPASVFYNLAMMPGWQKWRPTFRIATISNINNDLCDITLDAATSSQQALNVNAKGSYSGVPIMYMECNGDAFEDGDRVLVAFSGNTDQPMVVGFENNPKECCYNPDFNSEEYVDDPRGTVNSLTHGYCFRVNRDTCIKSINTVLLSKSNEGNESRLAVYKCQDYGKPTELMFYGEIFFESPSDLKNEITHEEHGFDVARFLEDEIIMFVYIRRQENGVAVFTNEFFDGETGEMTSSPGILDVEWISDVQPRPTSSYAGHVFVPPSGAGYDPYDYIGLEFNTSDGVFVEQPFILRIN